MLAVLAAAAKENHEGIAVSAKVDAIAWTKVHTQLHDPFTYALCGDVSVPQTVDCYRHPRTGLMLKPFVPSFKSISAMPVDILLKLQHRPIVAQKIPHSVTGGFF